MKFQISITLPYIQHIFIMCFNEYLAWWLLGPKHVAITTTELQFCKRLLILHLNSLYCLLENKSIYGLPFKTSSSLYVQDRQFVCSRQAVCMFKTSSLYVQDRQFVCSRQAVCMFKTGSIYVQDRQSVCSRQAVYMFKTGSLYVQDMDFVDEDRKFPFALEVYGYLRQYTVSLYDQLIQISTARLTELWLTEFLKRIYCVLHRGQKQLEKLYSCFTGCLVKILVQKHRSMQCL